MNDIRSVLRKASWRLGITEMVRLFVLLLSVGVGVAIVVRLVQLFVAFWLPWDVFAYWSLGAVTALAVVGAIINRAKPDVVARRVDEGADLRETISTALYVEKSDEPWARATLADAAERVKRVDVRQAVPITPPRFWPVPMALGLAMAVLLVLKPMDLIGLKGARLAEEDHKAQIIQAKNQTQEMREKIKQMDDALGLEPFKPETLETPKTEPTDPDAIRKAMIKQISKKAEQIEALKQSENGLKIGALKDAMKKLRAPGAELAPMTQAMAKGDFSKAQEELLKLSKQLAEGSLSEEQKKALGEQMQNLADQLNQLAQQQDQLKKQLEQAGLDPNLASNPQALSEAMQQMSNLSPEQKQALQNMAQAAQQSQGACQNMSSAMSQMAQACSNPNGQQQGGQQGQQGQQGEQGAQQMSQQLSSAEMAEQEMQSAQASLAECKQMMQSLASQCNNPGGGEGQGSDGQGGNKNGSDSTGQWAQGETNNQGGGQGGPGIGNGGSAGEEAAKFNAISRKAIGNVGEGPMIGTTMVQGEQVKGESKAAFTATVAAAAQEASEEITSNVYPREYHDAIKAYFGNLQRKVKESDDAAADDDKGKADEPAGDAADADKPADK